MSWKACLKGSLPKSLHYLYNRVISRRKIGQRIGSWFDLDWKRRAERADARTWIATYDQSWDHWQQEDLSPKDLEKIAALIPRSAMILDAGCGDGYLLAALTCVARARVGVDLSGKALRLARTRLGQVVPLAQAFLEHLPFRDGAFDVVGCAHTLEHVRDLDRVVAELKRVTRRRLIILVPAQEYLPYTEDYHVHYFPQEDDLRRYVGLPQARCERYTVPPGVCAYQGDVLLLCADL